MTNKLLLIFLRGLPLNCETQEGRRQRKAGAKGKGEQGVGQPGPGGQRGHLHGTWQSARVVPLVRCQGPGLGLQQERRSVSLQTFLQAPKRVGGCWRDKSHGGENHSVLPCENGVKKSAGIFWISVIQRSLDFFFFFFLLFPFPF